MKDEKTPAATTVISGLRYFLDRICTTDAQFINNSDQKILKKYNNRCVMCGATNRLIIIRIIDQLDGIPKKCYPPIFKRPICQSCAKQLSAWDSRKKVKNPDLAFEKYLKVYHSGVYRAEQHLKFEI